MSEVPVKGAETLSTAPGHLTVHFEDQHPTEIPFLFEQQERRMPRALAVSAVSHAAIVILAVLAVRYVPATEPTQEYIQQRVNQDIVWIAQEGPGGGGGGGGNRMPLPARKAELPGRDKISVPVSKPLKFTPRPEDQPKDDPKPDQRLEIPAMALGAGVQTLPGVIDGGAPNTLSQGPGTGGGSGTGTGSGIGEGTGSGLGPGWGGGTGGGPYRPGSGIELPRVLREVKPQYTADAMRAKVQGTVIVECIVLPDGTVGDVHVVRSLDPVFGLDQEAIKAAKQWRFVPGTKQGQPVPVLVTIELTFTLR
jgi:TonB family protein